MRDNHILDEEGIHYNREWGDDNSIGNYVKFN